MAAENGEKCFNFLALSPNLRLQVRSVPMAPLRSSAGAETGGGNHVVVIVIW